MSSLPSHCRVSSSSALLYKHAACHELIAKYAGHAARARLHAMLWHLALAVRSRQAHVWSASTHNMPLSPAQFGVFVLTTSAGIMDHEEARRKKVGGKVSLLTGWQPVLCPLQPLVFERDCVESTSCSVVCSRRRRRDRAVPALIG